MTGLVWTVASAQTARRWAAAVPATAYEGLALAWSETVAVGEPEGAVRALARVGPDLVLLTSPNALAHLPPGIGTGLDAACVGETTARAARTAGFAVRHVGKGSGADLAHELVAGGEPGLVLFLRGEVVRHEGADILEGAGWRVEHQVVYAARPREAFDAEVAAAPAPAAVVVGSPQGATALARALDAADRGALRAVPTVAIGETTARRLKSLDFSGVEACRVPGLEGILALLGDLLRRDPSS